MKEDMYKNPLFFQLVFDYSIKKLKNSGRFWADQAYGNSERIFTYSVASAATWLDFNSHLPFRIYTDNVELYSSKIEQYRVNLTNTEIIDISENLDIWKQHRYCFNPAIKIVQWHKDFDWDIVFMDNDLSFKKSFDEYLTFDGMLQGHREHYVDTGNPLWGEKHACRIGLNKTDFWVYDKNVLGFTNKLLKQIADEAVDVQEKLVDVDISNVTDVDGSIWHCCEQTAWSYLVDKYKIPVMETKDTYHQYYVDKESVIKDAQKLLK